MIVTALLIALGLWQQATPAADNPALDGPAPTHAERCYGQVMLLIEEAAASGPVAGPSWFIRDYWGERLPEDRPDEREAQVRERLLKDQHEDLAAFAVERSACINEAIDAGAVPGMGPA